MNILITGGAGFIGSNYINHIKDMDNINKIIVLDNLSHGTFLEGTHDHEKVDFNMVDIREYDVIEDLFKDVDVVIHLAGLVSIYDCDKNIYEAYDNNVLGTVNVLRAMEHHKIKRIIAAETSAVYEDVELPKGGYREETADCRTIYSASKKASADLIRTFSKTRDINYTLLRFFNVYGELQDWKRTVPPASAGFAIRLMQDKSPIIFGDIDRRRDFIHVNDVVSFINIILQNDKAFNETYNIGTGKSYSLREMINVIGNILNKTNIDILYKEEIAGEAFEIYANIDKAKDLGWSPKIDFHSGHKSLISYLQLLYNNNTFPKDFMDHINIKDISLKV